MTDSTQTAEQLLKRVSEKLKIVQELYRETGITYNVFKVMLRNDKEVKMCSVFADLLNPKGQHYRGKVYLELFLEMVVKPLITVNPLIGKAWELNLSNVNVRTEYPIAENRRIDIVLDDGRIFLPIEVKFKATELENQLVDYAIKSEEMNADTGFIPVLFLTPDGRKSIDKTLNDKKYIPISFEKHIIPWLKKCLSLKETDKALPVKEVLKQFINAIKSFCGCEDEKMENDIYALITESRDNFDAALRIYKAVLNKDNKEQKLNFYPKVLESFEHQISKLVEKSLDNAKYNPNVEGDPDWKYIDIPIGHDYKLLMNYNLKWVKVMSVESKTIDNVTKDNIRKKMSGITGSRSDEILEEGCIWYSKNVKYPGFKDIDIDIDIDIDVDGFLFLYELYQTYLKEPEKVADWIVAMANKLKSI